LEKSQVATQENGGSLALAPFHTSIIHVLTQKSTHWNPRASVRQARKSQPSVPVNLTSKSSRSNVGILDQLERTRRKRKEKVKSPKKCKGIVNFVVLDVYQVFPIPYN